MILLNVDISVERAHPNSSIKCSCIFWYKNGQWHREDDGPAIEYDAGTKYWRKNGRLHRDPALGPAMITINGYKEYWLDGKELIDYNL